MTKNTVKILDVVRLEPDDSELLFGYALEKPQLENNIDGSEIELGGWVIGKKSAVVRVEVVNNERVLRKIPVDELRPDLGRRYPDVAEAKRSGFVAIVDLLELPETGELLLQTVLADESKILIGRVKYSLEYLSGDAKGIILTEERKSLINLEEIKADLERSRTFLQKIQENLEQMGVG